MNISPSWACFLLESSPRFNAWYEIFGTRLVPIKSPKPVHVSVPGGEVILVYEIDVTGLDGDQTNRLFAWVASRFGIDSSVAQFMLIQKGFPIFSADVVVAVNSRMVV